MKNWKTTLAGVLGAVVTVAVSLYQTGTVDVQTWITAIVMAALGVLAKDLNVTGGSVQQ